MKKILFLITLIASLFASPTANAVKYKFDPSRGIQISQVSTGSNDWKWVKVVCIAKNANKAIEQSQIDAIESCLFYGIAENKVMGLAKVIPICEDESQAFMTHKKFFEKLFKKDIFKYYIKQVHTGYPTGENNVRLFDGKQKVTIEFLVDYEGLRNLLKENNINTSW
jgi:hypothetical protein